MKKRFLSILTALCLTLTLLPTAALAAEGEDDENESTETTIGVVQGSDGKSYTSIQAAVEKGQTELTLTGDTSLDITEWPAKGSLAIDLNQNTITITNTENVKFGIAVPENETLTLENGSIKAEQQFDGAHSVFVPKADATIVLDHITMVTNGTALYPAGNAAEVVVRDSTITAGCYAIGTNASMDSEGDLLYSSEVKISLEKSTISTTGYKNNDGDDCTILLNVPGTLTIDNCEITGHRVAVLVRGGEATIRNSEINLSDVFDGADKDKYDENWGSGNAVPMGALIVGNQSQNAYKYSASCTLIDTKVTAEDGARGAYVYGIDKDSRSAGLTVEGESEITVSGEAKSIEIAGEGSQAVVTGGTFSTDVSQYFPEDVSLKWDENTHQVVIDTSTAVAKVNGVPYATLQAAIDVAQENQTVTLLKDTPEDITIGEGKKITLDMGSHTLTNQSGDTISNHGTLTVIGSGTVDNITHGKGAIVNYVGAIANLNGGTFTRSWEQTSNSWYTVKNLGEMTIDGATVQTGENSTGSSSLIANGWYNSDSPTTGDRNEEHKDSTVAKLTIISGTFSGGMNTVKNDDYGVLNIEGGTFANTTGPLILNWNEATISGGTFTANTGAALANGYLNDSGDKGQFTITGGTFTSGNNGESGLFAYGDSSKNGGTLSIRGGVFVGQLSGSAPYKVSISAGSFSNLVPEEYCAEDFVPVTTKDDNGMYTVTKEAEDGTTVTGLTLEPKNLTLTDGETYQLKAGTTPEGSSLTWTSSNTSVVKVNSSGRVTAVGAGTATIKVEAGQLSLTCKVTVKAAPSSSGSSSSDPSYSPILDVSDGGSIKVNPRTPEEDDEVTITVDPDSGYEVDEVTVTDRNGREVKVTAERDGTYTFTQPRGRVTISVTFVREGGSTFFSDVPESFWAYDEIAWAYDNGYVNGTSASAFSPNASISRQQVWMILARLSGADPANMSAAREWAVTNGVSDGTTPGGAVTRQQLVALLYRYATLMGYANDQRADLSAYPDAGTVAGYAVEPMQWSVANSIVGGTSNGTLDPTGTATRAQFAVILYRFWDQVG